MTISIKPFSNPSVTIPAFLSFNQGEQFVRERMNWVIEKRTEMAKYEKQYGLDSENIRTRSHKLELVPHDSKKIHVGVAKGLIKIKYPEWEKTSSHLIQNAIRRGIIKAYKTEAVEYLPKRLNDLSDKYKLPFKELYIKNIKSRWGSCSSVNNINLSIHLMRLPDHLVDYVILHELAHTKIKNHSKNFWNMLDTLTGNSKGLDKELKRFRIH